MSRFGGPLGAIQICVLALLAAGADAEDSPAVSAGPEAVDESIEIEEPGLPGLPSDVLRIWFESRFEPSADAGDTEVSLIEPGVRVRLRAPLGDRAGLQLTGAFRTSRYDVDDQGALFEGCAGVCPSPDEFYATSIGAQGALQVNDEWFVLRDDERWAVIAEGFGRARWEPGAFDKSLSGGGAIAFGYELPQKLRIAVGVRVESSLDGGSVSVSPTGAFRWEITESLQLRNRGIGLQLDLRAAKPLELFVAGYRTSSRYRLDSREDLPAGALFRDRQWLVGGGLEWRPWDLLRIAIESGAIVDRKLSLRARDEGTLDSASVDTSPYVGLRLEIRP